MEHSAYGTPDLLRCSRGVLFGEHTPKLPGRPLLAFDEVVDISAGGGKYGQGFAVAKKRLSPDHWVFEHHFYRDPVMPGALLIDGLLQLTGFFGAYVGQRGQGRAVRVEHARFLGEVTPSDGEILFQIVIRKCNKSNHIIVTEGKVTANGTERTTAGELWVVIRPPQG